jgi:hypothetical protein
MVHCKIQVGEHMIKRCACVIVLLFLLGAWLPGASITAVAQSGQTPVSCTALLRSASGNTTVQVCPPVVPSGQMVFFVIHSGRNQSVSVVLRYPTGSSDRLSGTTDSQGALTLSMPVRYNPLYRYAQIPFVITAGAASDTISGSVRVAQMNNEPQARMRVRQSTSKAWCGDDHCVVRDNSTVVIRIDTTPSAQVQLSLTYPNGESVPCPGNDLGGGMFADGTGAFVCRLPVYYDLSNTKSQVTVTVEASVTVGTYTIPLQYKLWLRAK